MTATLGCDGWLAPGRSAAVCLSLDDVHPGRSRDAYEAGGDRGDGVLGRLARLLEGHPQLRATLMVTPDWRERSPVPTRARLARVPVVRDLAHLTPPLVRGTMRLDRHPEFVAYLHAHPRFEVAVHGLTHLARGPQPPLEFRGRGPWACRRRVARAGGIFAACGLDPAGGFCPPAWGLSPPLERALVLEGYRWVAATRDIRTPIVPGATTAMSGPHGLALLEPQWIAERRLVHIGANFQATSDEQRALAILDCGGLLSIKAHAIKDALGHIALDGLDDAYCEMLDRLFERLAVRYGDALWWTTMGEVAERAWQARDAPAL
ncbi:MAG: hypothetical protein QOD44_3078 [Solirubrobacteraceae bacterium]|nr:hypothetical protein [Solirubrobacteraceae bacterium]